MTIPDSIQSLLDAVLREVEADAEHSMNPMRRREVYALVGAAGGPSALGWLGVTAADRVLPIFLDTYPDDTVPQQMLETAVQVLHGQSDDSRVANLLDLGSHASGGAWGYDEREIPWPAWLAGNACFHALKEACGQEPLSFLPDFYKGGVPTAWSDVELSEMSFCDSAAAAALASSSDERGTAYDPQKLLVFWTWWLGKAVRAALEANKLPPAE
jgi:hypothetical protein